VIAPLLAALIAASTPPAPGCQASLGPLLEGIEEAALPNQIDGATISGRDGLIALRRARGEVLLTVKGGNFARADLRGAALHNICFVETDLSGSDWREARAPGIGFIRVNLTGADLRGARLEQLLLRDANMTDVNAEGAYLARGRLDGGWFEGSVTRFNLDRADLTGFRFDCGITLSDGCPVDQGEPQISLRGANLTDANLFGYQSLEGARVDRTEVAITQLRDLATADLAGPIRLRGGDAVVELDRYDYRALVRNIGPRGDAPSPSFDCGRAASATERQICGPEGGRLRWLDREVAALYRAALARNPGEARAQAAWLRTRDRCEAANADYGCLEEAYEARKAVLAGRVGPPAWLRPGAYALFVDPSVSFDEGFHADPLFQRIVPVLLGHGWSHVAVRVNVDGSLEAVGSAVGANAHSCSLEAPGLQLDPASGYYSARPTTGRMRGRPVPVLLVHGDWVEVYAQGRADPSSPLGEAASDYASCGARAGFGEMLLMPVSQDEARRRFEEGGELP
jgi:uncharacterized protein YjbI with pentapeptide repeats